MCGLHPSKIGERSTVKYKKGLYMDNIKELIGAIEVRKSYNKMPFKEFVVLVEKHIGTEISQIDKDDFKFTGLMNTDFLSIQLSNTVVEG